MQRADDARNASVGHAAVLDEGGPAASALRGQGLRVLAGLLLAAGLLLLAFRMELSYFRLHLFLLGPVIVLALVPPRPLQDAPRKLRRTGYLMVPVMILVVAAFSTVWDNYVASWGVWTFDSHAMLGTAGFIPFEEYFWFIDHTLLVSFWVLSLWSVKQTRPMLSARPSRKPCLVGAVLCLATAAAGVVMIRFDPTFWLGVILAFMGPVSAYQWWSGGHFLLEQRREWLLGIAVPSLYLIGLDTWAIHEGVWAISEQFTTGVRILGVQIEQILIYSYTTTLVAQAFVAYLRRTEVLLLKSAG